MLTERPYQAPPRPTDPPKYLIVEGPGMTAERAEAEEVVKPMPTVEGGRPGTAETPAGETQLE